MQRPRSLSILLAVLAAGTAMAADAGWSGNPYANSPLADRDGDQVQVKLAATNDGGVYASWLDNALGGYDVALQRIDSDGAEVWPHNGIIVADTGFEWTTDYSLTVDSDDEALLAFRDDRGGSESITIARIAPTGAALWGPEGIRVDASSEFLGPPVIASTSDDRIVVAWTRGADVHVRKLDLAGQPLWADDVTFPGEEGASQFVADLQPTPDGGVLVSWVHSLGFYEPRHLRAQRLSPEGTSLWGEPAPDAGREPLAVFDQGTLQYGSFPPFVGDGEGGAVFAWYETDPVLQVRVQHVLADGLSAFPTGGVLAAAADPAVERVEPAMAYDAQTQDIYVFWREMYPSGPLDQWIRGQRLGADGLLGWGESGIEVEGHGEHELTQLQAVCLPGGAAIAYVQKLAEGDQRVWIRRLGPDGTSLWPAGRTAVSSVPSGKSRLQLTGLRSINLLLGWQDTRAGNEDVYLQFVGRDGSLGPTYAAYLPFVLARQP